MPLYEHVFIARQDVTSQAVDQFTEQLSNVITERGGKVASHEYWGLRTLSFRIKKNRKGHYVLLNIDAPPAAIAEVERLQRINEDVIRFLTVRVEKLAEGLSPIMRAKERDAREGRGDRDRDRYEPYGDNA